MEYCCVVWSPHQVKLQTNLEKVQRAAARFVANKPHRRDKPDSVSAIIKELGWKSLEERRRRARLMSFYKMRNNLTAIPPNYHPTLKMSTNTRRANKCQYQQQQSNILAHQHSFIVGTIPDWNNLPDEVASAPSLETFKKRLASVPLK